MELFCCVFIFLVAFSSAVKVQSRKVSLSYAGPCQFKSDNYLRADCSATKSSLNSSQCEARADGSSKGNAESRFQLLPVEIKETENKCIQFTNRSSGEKYALKVVNQSRVVFEKHRCDADGNDPEEFRFKQERYESGEGPFQFVYKPFKNQSLCVSKDCVSQKLTLYSYDITQNETPDTTPFDRRCAFTREFIKNR